MFYSLNFDCVPTGNLLPARSCTAPDSPPPLPPRSVQFRTEIGPAAPYPAA